MLPIDLIKYIDIFLIRTRVQLNKQKESSDTYRVGSEMGVFTTLHYICLSRSTLWEKLIRHPAN
jgi:hypothetical protein